MGTKKKKKKNTACTELKHNTKSNFLTVAPSNFAPCLLGLAEYKGLSTVKLDQRLLICGVSTGRGTLQRTNSLYRADLSQDSHKSSWSRVYAVRDGEVDCHYRPPAASLSWPDVCHRQMMRKRQRGWRALRKHRKTPEERRDCLRPLVLTGLSFNSICSIAAVCVEPDSIAW